MIRRRIKSSRLARTNEKQNKRQALFFTVGIVVLIVILIQFGPFLVNIFGNIVYTLRGGDKGDNTQLIGNAILQAPMLSDIPNATQSSRISFRGTVVLNEGTVEIYVNDELADEIEIENSNFEVRNLLIDKGRNIIKARVAKNDQTSPFSEEVEINYISEFPKLEVTFPTDGAEFTKADKTVNITGTTEPENTVWVNSFRAIVDSGGKFSYLLQLNDGENNIVIETKNQAGISSQKTIKVTYSP